MSAADVGLTAPVVTEVSLVWLQAFLVPVAVFGHVTSLRQLLAPPRPKLAVSRHRG